MDQTQGRTAFQNDPLPERLDVTFANRYLTAYEQFRSGQKPTLSWQLAFQTTAAWYPLIVQQLLVGINAHICPHGMVWPPRNRLTIPGHQAGTLAYR
jgi:hypothetical protein